MIDTIASFDGRIAKVHGSARSGKTEALVRRCAHVLNEGAAPSSILVEVSSAFAAQAFRQRLRKALATDKAHLANEVRICTALDACVDVLNTPAARNFTGRIPRLLTSTEYNFFLEDMKTLGAPIRRLRKMLDYFYRSMSDYVPRAEWLVGGEEETVLAHLERTLALREGMLVQEAPALCADFLKSADGISMRKTYAYVLCDDFQNMSRAEQTCLCLLAEKQVLVCGNADEQQVIHTAYPNADGFSQFETVRHDVTVFALPEPSQTCAIARFVAATTNQTGHCAAKAGTDHEPSSKPSSSDELSSSIESIKWQTPEDELNGLTKYIRVLLDAEDNLHENRTCVVVPNKRWTRMVEKVLKQRGFSVTTEGAFAGINGDPRESTRAQALVAYTKLNLLANPCDTVAWRSWCGFDNHLTNSDAWNNLQDFANQHSLTLIDALAHIAQQTDEPFLRAHVLAERWNEGQAFIAKNAGRTGFGLLRAIGAENLPEFEHAASVLVGDENAGQLYLIERAHATDPTWNDNPHLIHVASFDTLCGTEYDTIFVIAAVDGFIPRRDAFEVISTEEERERIMDEERRRFCNTVSKATKRLVLSHFSKASLELAERTKMQVARVRAENGERVAVIRPCCFLAEAGDTYPGTISGQNLLAERGLV